MKRMIKISKQQQYYCIYSKKDVFVLDKNLFIKTNNLKDERQCYIKVSLLEQVESIDLYYSLVMSYLFLILITLTSILLLVKSLSWIFPTLGVLLFFFTVKILKIKKHEYQVHKDNMISVYILSVNTKK